MRFQTKIFLFFIISIIVSLISTTSFVYYLLDNHTKLFENIIIEDALLHAYQIYKSDEYNSKDKQDKILNQLNIINREYTKSKVLKKDILISGEVSLLLFLFVQSILLLLLFFFVIRAITTQLRIIFNGLKRMESSTNRYRFPVLKGKEFEILGNELNKLLNKKDEQEKIIKEKSKIAGWQEVTSFLSHQLKNPLTSIGLAKK